MPAVLVSMVIVFGLINPNFWSVTNMANVSRQTSILALISIGQTFAILSAGIDLSVGSLLALVSVVCAQQMLHFGLIGGIVAGILAGGLAGFVNGVLIAKARVPAFWAGLLYDGAVLDTAWELVRDWNMEERLQLRIDAPKLGLKAMVRGRTLQSIALEVLDMASSGLSARARLGSSGENETGFLEPLYANVRAGLTPADKKLALYHGRWNGSVDPLFTEAIY